MATYRCKQCELPFQTIKPGDSTSKCSGCSEQGQATLKAEFVADNPALVPLTPEDQVVRGNRTLLWVAGITLTALVALGVVISMRRSECVAQCRYSHASCDTSARTVFQQIACESRLKNCRDQCTD